MTHASAIFIIVMFAGSAIAQSCSGCGCKGGPGYRDPSTGHCVGWRDLDRRCGHPPESRCLFEGAPGSLGKPKAVDSSRSH
jgi:hypothetical protein